MKITCARNKDQIIQERDAYKQRKATKQARRDEHQQRYRQAQNTVITSIKSQIEDAVSAFSDLHLDIHVGETMSDTWEATIKSNEDRLFSESKALTWEWSARIDGRTGEVIKKSGSWSGLNAVTTEQVESLKQSAACLEVLNSLDWATILGVDVPDYKDYMDDDDFRPDPEDKRNFDAELLEADIENAMNNGWLIQGHGYRYNNERVPVFYRVLKETPSQYKVEELDIDDMNNIPGPGESYAYNIKKDTFLNVIDKPIDILEV